MRWPGFTRAALERLGPDERQKGAHVQYMSALAKRKRFEAYESRHSLWRPGNPAAGRDGISTEAAGAHWRQADFMAHHEIVFPCGFERFCLVSGLSRQHDQGVLPELRGNEQ